MLNLIYNIGKDVLFNFEPEIAHELFAAGLKTTNAFIPQHYTNEKLHLNILNKKIVSPISLAAGFDKYGELFPYLSLFGFGFCELGSFTLYPQDGNPKPRLKRFVKENALINKMGFNNPGIKHGLDNIIKCYSKNKNIQTKIAISFGKSKITPNEDALKEYEITLENINQFLNNSFLENTLYIVMNISSPNTPGLRDLQTKQYIEHLAKSVKNKSQLPLFVKLAPDFTSDNLFIETIEAAVSAKVDGFILTNTSMQYSLLSENEAEATEFGGGLSGKPLTEKALYYLKLAKKYIPKETILIASGGIMTKEDIWNSLLHGASLVQLYSGFVYNGPQFIWESEKYILQKLKEININSLQEFLESRQ